MDPIQDPFLHNLDDKDLIVISTFEQVSLYFTNSKISLSQQGLTFNRFEATVLKHLCIYHIYFHP